MKKLVLGIDSTGFKLTNAITKGLYVYNFGDTARLTPLAKMYTLGHAFVPSDIHAGGS